MLAVVCDPRSLCGAGLIFELADRGSLRKLLAYHGAVLQGGVMGDEPTAAGVETLEARSADEFKRHFAPFEPEEQ